MKKAFCIMISVIAVIFLCLHSNKVEAKESYDKNVYENSDEIYINGDINRKYEDTDLNQYVIDDYHTKLLGKNVEGSKLNREYKAKFDDPIVNIIPRDYFTSAGEHYSDGEEYYYHIITTEETGYLNGVVGGKTATCYKSAVIYVNYEQISEPLNNIELFEGEEKSCFTHKIDVHQFIFYTLNLKGNEVYWPQVFAAMNKLEVGEYYSYEDIVVPKPTYDENGYKIVEHNNHFWINNICCVEQIENTHDVNSNGLFLISASLCTNKNYYENLCLSDEIDINDVVGDCLDLIPMDPFVETAIDVLKLVYDTAVVLKRDWKNNIITPNVVTQEEIFNKSTNFFYTSKDDQMETGGLIKNYIYSVEDGILKADDYYKFNFRFSHDSTDKYKLGAKIKTKFVYTVNFDGRVVNEISHDMQMEVINGEWFSKVETSTPINGFNAVNTFERYIFTPSKTGVYNFNVSNNQLIELYLDDEVIPTNSNLIEGNNYIIKIINQNNTDSNYTLEIKSLEDILLIDTFNVWEDSNNIKIDLIFLYLDNYSVKAEGIGIFNINSDKTCHIIIPKSFIYNEISYFGLLPNLKVYVNDETSMNLVIDDSVNNYVRNQDYIKNHYNEIIGSIPKSNAWYNINTEIQFLSMFYLYSKDEWIYYDDGLNDDSYFIDDAQTEYIRICRDLDFKGYSFDIPYKVYFYGSFNGQNHIIKNLNLNSNFKYLYIENYGYFGNIKFYNCDINSLFKYNTNYGTIENVIFM